MIITKKKSFAKGLVMTIVFAAILVAMFLPLFGGENAFAASDKLFNSISKGSTNYFPRLREGAKPHQSKSIDAKLEIADKGYIENAHKVLTVSGLKAGQVDGGVSLEGTMGQLIEAVLVDSEMMFFNKGEELSNKYGGIGEKEVLFTWWKIFEGVEKALNDEKRFIEAAYLKEVMSRGISVGYNFYGIEPEDAMSKAGILSFALIFYILYTLWWGFAIFFLFEGFGLDLTGGHKEEA